MVDHPSTAANLDAGEVVKHEKLVKGWWDADGPMWGLHVLNPTRCQFIRDVLEESLPHKSVGELSFLDVGCGAGILTEAIAREFQPHRVVGIDASAAVIDAAREHLSHASTLAPEEKARVQYECVLVEDLVSSAQESSNQRDRTAIESAGLKPPMQPREADGSHLFDVIVCSEVLEHVPSPQAMVTQMSRLLRPGGILIISTLNRNVISWIISIVIAEHLLRWLEPHTHSYDKYIKPSELDAYCTSSNLSLTRRSGMVFNPFRLRFSLLQRVDWVNYICAYKKAP